MGTHRYAIGRRAGGAALVTVLLVHLLLCALARPGFLASDDLFYSRYANDFADGTFVVQPNHFANRLGLIAPTAASYALFGVGEVPSVLWPLLCSLVSIVVVYLSARALAGSTGAVLAAALAGLNPAQVNSSLLLLPDGPTGTLLLAAAAALLAARKTWGSGGRFGLAALTAGLVTAAFLTKMTAVWIVPFFVVLGMRDLARRSRGHLWISLFALLLLAGVGYLVAYRQWTGDALYRLHVIEGGHNLSGWSYVGLGGDALFARLVWEPAVMILRHPELGIPLLLAIPVAISSLRRGAGEHGRWAVYLLSILGSYWLLPTSLEAWNPLPLLPRMLLPVLPAAAILGGYALVEIRVSSRLAYATAGGLAIAALASVFLAGPERSALYGATAVLVAAVRVSALSWPRVTRAAPFAAAAPLVLLAAYSVAMGGVGETRAQAAERWIVAEHLDPGVPATLFTDSRSASALRFRLGLPKDLRITFWPLLADPEPPPEGAGDGAGAVRCYAYVNEERLGLIRRRGREVPTVHDLARIRGWDVVESRDGVTLYRRP